MILIDNITDDASQIMTLTGIPGVQIVFTLRFMPRIQQWVMGVNDGTNSIQGISVLTGLNILRQWKNILPYGIACVRSDGLDPYQINDFSSGISNLYLLNAADVANIEAEWFE